MKKTNLVQQLNELLKPFYPDLREREYMIKEINDSLGKSPLTKVKLDTGHYIFLSREERNMPSPRRYKNSPLPLLSNLENFRTTLGEWNEDLLPYGIHLREKLNDRSNNEGLIGNHVYLVNYKNSNSQCNRYLVSQYSRLEKLRRYDRTEDYWKLAWTLMSYSWSYKWACLNSWKPTWYKDYSPFWTRRLFTSLNDIILLKEVKTLITNVWIESPKGKWRQLGIPPTSWRLFFHMLNQFLSYQIEPSISPLYDGFLYNRGCKSWWLKLLNSSLLNMPHIVELDLSSGFPNLSLHAVQQSLDELGKTPLGITNLLMNYMLSPLKPPSEFPTLSSYIEDKYNSKWRTSCRSVHMGIGISPLLFLITLNNVMKKTIPPNDQIEYKWYADDGSFYFTTLGILRWVWSQPAGLYNLLKALVTYQNPLVYLLNNNPHFKKAGLTVCPQKSKIVKLFTIWIHPLSSLGLQIINPLSWWSQLWNRITYRTDELKLKAKTRGRGFNKMKQKNGTLGSKTTLTDLHPDFNLWKLYQHLVYFGYILSRLYASPPDKQASDYPPREGKPRPGSLQALISHKLKAKVNKTVKKQMNLYNTGCKLNNYALNVLHCNHKEVEMDLIYDDWRLFKIPWETKGKNPLTLIKTSPLKEVDDINPENYFRKFQEINLNAFELSEIKKEYEISRVEPNLKKQN